MRVLVLGAGGMLARDVIATAPANVEIETRTREQLDITDAASVRVAVADVLPDVIINCAAYTQVDGAESHRDLAFAVNGDGPGIVGRAAVALRGRSASGRVPLVVHFSTDYVFDGRSTAPYVENAATNPLGAYGASKLAGERSLEDSGAAHIIVRTQWLFGLHGRSFPRTMWQRALGRQATRVVSDQFGRPTNTADLAQATWRLITSQRDQTQTSREPRSHGEIVHIANRGSASWFDVAERIFQRARVPDLVTPCTTAQYPTPAPRPAWSVLDTTRFERLTATELPVWQDAVDRFLDALEQSDPCE